MRKWSRRIKVRIKVSGTNELKERRKVERRKVERRKVERRKVSEKKGVRNQ